MDREVIDKFERYYHVVFDINMTQEYELKPYRVEKREAKLRHMINTVQRDRKKIQTTINALEKHKFEAIKRTWELVNE